MRYENTFERDFDLAVEELERKETEMNNENKRNTRIKLSETWCKAHHFPTKIKGNNFYWQTAIQTAEVDLNTGKLKWHSRDFFNEI